MKSRIQVLHVVQNAGRSKKTGNDYDLRLAQCIVHKVDRKSGEVTPLIGELLLPKEFNDIKPGLYDVEFEVAITNDKRVGAVVCSMDAADIARPAGKPSGKPPESVAA